MIIEVEPGALESAAVACDRAADTMAGVVASVRSHGAPDTGRADTRAALADVLARLDAAMAGMGTALRADAAALRASGTAYKKADGSVLPGGGG